jgi:hypothetical protein
LHLPFQPLGPGNRDRATIEQELKLKQEMQMMKTKNWLVVAGLAAALCSASNVGMAQQDNGPGGRPGRGPFDPAQFRQMIMDRAKEELEVTNDDEWKALEPLVQKVMDARMQSMGGMGRGMMRPRRNPDDQGGGAGGGGGMRRGPFGEPSPEQEALQKAIDAKASKAELKAAIAKFVDARKAKEEQLKAAQDELRKVLTTRQEAIATANGLL